jgi:cation diffusion facilitator family transporter
MSLGSAVITILKRRYDPKWKANAKFLILLLIDSPVDKKQLLKSYSTGIMITYSPDSDKKLLDTMGLFDTYLAALVAEGYIEDEKGLFRLTQKGSASAARIKGLIARRTNDISSGLPASFISIIVNIVISVVSLAAGLLTNSMGLISSGLDNLVSVFTSAAAYLGIKFRAEALANMAIVVIIAIVALVLGYESVGRLLSPQPFETGILPISAAIFTGVACFGLAIFQRYMGNRSGKLSLIILSVDNINSVYISIAVLVGILFAREGIRVADPLVSLGVVLIMLKSAYDLGKETIKVVDGAEPDLTRYELRHDKRMNIRRKERFMFWTLYLLKEPMAREELEDLFSLDNIKGLEHIATMLRLDLDYSRHCAGILEEFLEEGLVIEAGGKYRLTSNGERSLTEALTESPERSARGKINLIGPHRTE